MSLKSLFISLSAAVVMMLTAGLTANAQTDKLSFGQYKITSIRATGFTSLRGTVAIDVNNSGKVMTVSNIRGTIYKGKTPFITGSADSFTIPAGYSTVGVGGNASLPTLSALLAFLANPSIDPASYYCDFSAEVKIDNTTQQIAYTGLRLSDIISR